MCLSAPGPARLPITQRCGPQTTRARQQTRNPKGKRGLLPKRALSNGDTEHGTATHHVPPQTHPLLRGQAGNWMTFKVPSYPNHSLLKTLLHTGDHKSVAMTCRNAPWDQGQEHSPGEVPPRSPMATRKCQSQQPGQALPAFHIQTEQAVGSFRPLLSQPAGARS